MREDGPDDRPVGAPDGPPSARAREELRADLRREVVDARLRFEEAGLRAETHRLLGDDRAAARVVEEQEQVLADLERRLGRVVSAAVLQRDAEEVLAGATPRHVPPFAPTPSPEPAGTPASGPGALESPAGDPVAPEQADAPRRRAPALSGVASTVAVLAVAALAVVGVNDSPSQLDVLGAADPAATDGPADDTATLDDAPSQRPLPPLAAGAGTDDAPTSGSHEADPQGLAADAGEGSIAPTPDEPTDLSTATLDELVAGLSDAMRQLGDGDVDLSDGDPVTDTASTVEDTVEEVVEELEEDAEQGTEESTEEDWRLSSSSDGPSDDDETAPTEDTTGSGPEDEASADEDTQSTTDDGDAEDGGFVSDSAGQ